MPLVTGGVLEGYEWTADVRYETEPPTRLLLKLKGRPMVETDGVGARSAVDQVCVATASP